MNADRIQVFHITDRDRSVIAVANDLVFNLFESFYAFFNQDLTDRGQGKSVFDQWKKFLFIFGKTASGAAESIGRTEYNGITDLRNHL